MAHQQLADPTSPEATALGPNAPDARGHSNVGEGSATEVDPTPFLTVLLRLVTDPSDQILQALLRAEIWKLLLRLRERGLESERARTHVRNLVRSVGSTLVETGLPPEEASRLVASAHLAVDAVADWPLL